LQAEGSFDINTVMAGIVVLTVLRWHWTAWSGALSTG
jgi:hypothetical protein